MKKKCALYNCHNDADYVIIGEGEAEVDSIDSCLCHIAHLLGTKDAYLLMRIEASEDCLWNCEDKPGDKCASCRGDEGKS